MMGECDRDGKGGPSIFNVICNGTSVTRMFPTVQPWI